ncbi:hypothetical protein PHMEG_0005810 [Phytophthora megakarya]|uniref:PiggyBac transposable element-derived protein domain-containing protein n=1 Tax=Phytophthora megakarya TaxID=4795 RepID=A0A225WQL4_9STRA|nr:hypothetical protein PHMEG_0005810 [Phytophthora megakarya]
MFGSSSEDEMELSQAAVSRAFGLSHGDLQVDDEERDAAASLNLLSEASGLESDGEIDEESAAPPQHTRNPLVKDDVNYVLDEEENCDYEDYSSGVSEDDEMRDDDSDIGCDGLEEDEDVLSDSDAVGLDEAFLASLQIGNYPLSRAAVKEREEALRAMKWTPVSSQYETDKPAYPGLGVEEAKPNAGSFGRYMTRDRCQNIMRDLHFVDNTTANRHDKLWKLHPVVDRIQQQFLAGWSLPAVFSFDEGVLPFTSRRNTTLMFMSDKPHRYGSKPFMMCDAKTAYCHRFEVYVGRRSTADATETAVDYKTGAAAVVRNLKVVLDDHSRHKWHAIVIDRYYSSVLLAVELLAMKVYVVGAVMTNRFGFDKNINDQDQEDSSDEEIGVVLRPSEPAPSAKAGDFAGVDATSLRSIHKRKRTPVRLTHALQQSEDWVVVSGVQKRRQRSCKVCALLRMGKKKAYATTFYCERCSIDSAKCWLCPRIRREYKGVGKTCYDIWHEDFGAGEDIPASIRKRVVLRRPGKKAGRRQKTPRELQLAGQGNDGGNNSDNGYDENDN